MIRFNAKWSTLLAVLEVFDGFINIGVGYLKKNKTEGLPMTIDCSNAAPVATKEAAHTRASRAMVFNFPGKFMSQ